MKWYDYEEKNIPLFFINVVLSKYLYSLLTSVITYNFVFAGDLGHVTSVSNPTVDDGDCRYLPKEILNDDYENLTKSDIFSLGLTMYEAVSCLPFSIWS